MKSCMQFFLIAIFFSVVTQNTVFSSPIDIAKELDYLKNYDSEEIAKIVFELIFLVKLLKEIESKKENIIKYSLTIHRLSSKEKSTFNDLINKKFDVVFEKIKTIEHLQRESTQFVPLNIQNIFQDIKAWAFSLEQQFREKKIMSEYKRIWNIIKPLLIVAGLIFGVGFALWLEKKYPPKPYDYCYHGCCVSHKHHYYYNSYGYSPYQNNYEAPPSNNTKFTSREEGLWDKF